MSLVLAAEHNTVKSEGTHFTTGTSSTHLPCAPKKPPPLFRNFPISWPDSA